MPDPYVGTVMYDGQDIEEARPSHRPALLPSGNSVKGSKSLRR